jgi:hypothetical protein
MIPPPKYITSNMLIRQFYDNHIFFQCDYDPKIMVNLNGKVIQSNENQFQTYLGFRKPMIFNVVGEGMREVANLYIKFVQIDNVIDESAYNQNSIMITTNQTNKREPLKRFQTKDEYLSNLQVLVKKHEDLKEIDTVLNELVDKLQNNYILINNQILKYSKHFQELVSDFRSVIFFNV